MRVLIVEDDVAALDMLRQQFENRGHAVCVAQSVVAANTAMCAAIVDFDVIVTDRDLGYGMTGDDFYRMLLPGPYHDKFVFFTTDLEDLPYRVPAVSKPNFDLLISTVEGLNSNG